jgi:hypothetical protein
MVEDRRAFLKRGALLAALALGTDFEAAAQNASDFDTNAWTFWTKEVNAPYNYFRL